MPQFTDAYFTPHEDKAAPYEEPTGVYSRLAPESGDFTQLGLITERNLVDFARQIAAGMVRNKLTLLHVACTAMFTLYTCYHDMQNNKVYTKEAYL